MRVTLIHNPGAGDDGRSAEALIRAIAAAGHRVRHASIRDDDWASTLEHPADVVAIAGGDGTVAPVVLRLRHRGVPVALIPEGSANNIARTLGVADDPLPPGRWRGARRARLDVGRAVAGGEERCFVESMGGGALAEVLRMAAADPHDRGGGDSLRLGRALLRRAVEAPAQRWGVVVDGADRSGPHVAVEVMNIRESGPRLALAPGAEPGDGLLDVVLVGPDEAPSLEGLAEPAGRWAEPLSAIRARRLALRLPPGTPLHADDALWHAPPGPGGWTSVDVEAAVGAVEVLIPGPARV